MSWYGPFARCATTLATSRSTCPSNNLQDLANSCAIPRQEAQLEPTECQQRECSNGSVVSGMHAGSSEEARVADKYAKIRSKDVCRPVRGPFQWSQLRARKVGATETAVAPQAQGASCPASGPGVASAVVTDLDPRLPPRAVRAGMPEQQQEILVALDAMLQLCGAQKEPLVRAAERLHVWHVQPPQIKKLSAIVSMSQRPCRVALLARQPPTPLKACVKSCIFQVHSCPQIVVFQQGLTHLLRAQIAKFLTPGAFGAIAFLIDNFAAELQDKSGFFGPCRSTEVGHRTRFREEFRYGFNRPVRSDS